MMENSVKKFLEFNGRTIAFRSIDGEHWVAIKPICEALEVNYDRQYKNLKSDEILSQLYAVQPMTGADGKLYKMVSLPEKFIYGWLFSIRSESEGLKAYKRACYEVLYEHFHGAIHSRSLLLKKKEGLRREAESLENRLIEDDDYARLRQIGTEARMINKDLKGLDESMMSNQLGLWNELKIES